MIQARRWRTFGVLMLGFGLVGCRGPAEVETTYGRSRGKSINGTNALADLIRGRGHNVRSAIRYNEILGDWAEVVVRFAPYPGPPGAEEANWLGGWLRSGSGRKLVYVPRDFDAAPEFWTQMLAALPPKTSDADRKKLEIRRTQSQTWPASLPEKAKQPASPEDWFATEPNDPKRPNDVTVCRNLEGPWSLGVDSTAAALPRRETLRAESNENVVLGGDGGKLAVTWSFSGDEEGDDTGNVLVLANGSFLLNAGLLNKARRPLAARVVDWVGDGPSNVAFVEGTNVLADPVESSETSMFHLLTVEPFDWVAAHLGFFGVLLCLSLAVRIGRPRPEPLGEIERPSAHPIALGAILARTRQVGVAEELIAAYRRWRQPSALTTRTDPIPPSPRRAPRA